jgi:uncharacterized membrane protein YfhO
MVLSEVNYPGWRAFVDGEPAPILSADYLLRAVSLGKGEHEVDFVYDPDSLKLGKLMSMATLVFAVIVIGFEAIVFARLPRMHP